MPRGDRTGPMGTGRELGFCAGYDTPGYEKGGGGRGRGFGFGGRGFRRRWGWNQSRYLGAPLPGYAESIPWGPAVSKDEEIRLLKTEADALKRAQKEIEKRLTDLEKEKEENT